MQLHIVYQNFSVSDVFSQLRNVLGRHYKHRNWRNVAQRNWIQRLFQIYLGNENKQFIHNSYIIEKTSVRHILSSIKWLFWCKTCTCILNHKEYFWIPHFHLIRMKVTLMVKNLYGWSMSQTEWRKNMLRRSDVGQTDG